jgi:capsular polysaccharide biosynthesis protein
VPTPASIEAKPFPIFGTSDFDLVFRRKLPTRYIAHIKACLVHGQSTATLTCGSEGAVHWAALPELLLGQQPGNYAGFFEAAGDRWKFSNSPDLKPTARLDRAVLVGTRYSFNYFHFVTDLLPRLLIADEQHPGDTSPLLVPPVAPQLIELLRLFAPNRTTMVMAPDDLVHVDDLVVPSSAAFSPDHFERAKEAVFDAPYLRALRPRLSSLYAPPRGETGKIVFIRRTDVDLGNGLRHRNIVNQEEVALRLERLGAIVVQPETMTMAAQIALFRQADVVVGMAGAGLTNAVFCRPGTALVLLCQNRIVNPEYFAFMADALELHYAVVACEPVLGSSEHPAHLSIKVALDNLDRAMSWAKALHGS